VYNKYNIFPYKQKTPFLNTADYSYKTFIPSSPNHYFINQMSHRGSIIVQHLKKKFPCYLLQIINYIIKETILVGCAI